MLARLSAFWARLERLVAAGLAAAVTLLILLNVVTRAFDASLFWVDEAAIYAMIWMTFLAASAAVQRRESVAVTLIPDVFDPRGQRWFVVLVDIVIFAFGLLMLWAVWRWFDPAGLLAAGGDILAFQGATFNFVYSEPTMTLGTAKAPIWSIVAIFACGVTLHGVANLSASLLALRTPIPA
ncbi:MAG: TRAP transporter small permease subunit [Jannaschia sp.]